MPQIPYAPEPGAMEVPQLSPGMVSLVPAEAAKMGEQVEETGRFFYALDQKSIGEEVKHRALMAENKMDAWKEGFASSLNNRTDYENFDKELDQSVQSFRQSVQGDLKVSRGGKLAQQNLQNAVDQAMNSHIEGLRQIIIAKRAKTIDDGLTIEFDKYSEKAMNDYINEPNQDMRNQIEAGVNQRAIALGTPFAMNKALNFLPRADEAQIRRDMSVNPVQTLKDLYDPKKYTNIDPVKKDELIEHTKRVADLDLRMQLGHEELIEKQFELNQKNLTTKFAIGITQGKDVTGAMVDAAKSGLLDTQGMEKIMGFGKTWTAARDKEDRAEDPAIKSQLELGVYGANPTVTPRDIDSAFSNGVINGKTYKDLSKFVLERGEKTVSREYTDAEKQLDLRFQTEGALSAQIDQGAKTLHADARRELYGLVYGPDKMPVSKALDIVEDKYGRALNKTWTTQRDVIRKSLTIPNNTKASARDMVSWLLNNKNTMPKASYLQQLRMLKDLEWIENTLVTQKAQRQKKEKEAEATTEGAE